MGESAQSQSWFHLLTISIYNTIFQDNATVAARKPRLGPEGLYHQQTLMWSHLCRPVGYPDLVLLAQQQDH